MTTQVYFHAIHGSNYSTPYITDNKSVEYNFDGETGSVCFDGYFYIEDHAPPYPENEALAILDRPKRYPEWLPKTVLLSTKIHDTELYTDDFEGHVHTFEMNTNIREEHMYVIEIYKREIYESTDKTSEIEEEDGQTLNVCFFPTNKQKIYFRVLETLV